MVQLFIPSGYRKKILIGVVLALILAASLAVTVNMIAGGRSIEKLSGSFSTRSQLILELTDPPSVPIGTTSLNLTYSQIELSVLEPQVNGFSSQILSIVPASNSETVDLMAIQNTSETLAISSLENGSKLTSATFIVSKIQAIINGTVNTITLATGGNTLTVEFTNPAYVVGARNALLLEFSPSIINSSSGYQMVPSSSAALKPQTEITGKDGKIGNTQQVSAFDRDRLHHGKGSIDADLLSLATSGNITTISVQVTNTGNSSERLVLFGIHGDFTWACPNVSGESYDVNRECDDGVHEIVMIPGEPHIATTGTTTISGCAPRHISLVNKPDIENDLANPIVMNPGQCLTFNFSGTIPFENGVIVPSMNSGQKFDVHVFAADGVQIKIGCILHSSDSPKCSAENDDNGQD